MANQEHLDILKQGVETWNQWRREHGDIRPNLGLADLSGTTLSGANLSKADLREANLNWANLGLADLNGANLGLADLSGTNLNAANLSNADLREANLREAKLVQANLYEADLSGANLSRADLREINLSRNNLSKADLREANLNWANLSNADLREANLSNAVLFQAILSGANLNAANLSKADLREADLRETKLININLRKARLDKADLHNADLFGAYLSWANLREANLSGATLFGAYLREVNLSKANLRGANLSRTNFFWPDIRAARDPRSWQISGPLSLIKLSSLPARADLTGADLTGADLTGADLTRVDLTGADLREANLSWANLCGANLNRADLTGCFVYATSTWDVQLEETTQANLIITVPSDTEKPSITVDNLEVAQFIYLLLNNQKVRNVIDTIAKKAVLILGRFTPERKVVLDALRDELRTHGYLPILFDFDKPSSRDLTETVSILAHLARFIIADLTEPSSIPKELEAIVPTLAVPVQPLLEGSTRPYAMFKDYWKYQWVLEVYRYNGLEELLASLKEYVIEPAEQKAKELAKLRAQEYEQQ